MRLTMKSCWLFLLLVVLCAVAAMGEEGRPGPSSLAASDKRLPTVHRKLLEEVSMEKWMFNKDKEAAPAADAEPAAATAEPSAAAEPVAAVEPAAATPGEGAAPKPDLN